MHASAVPRVSTQRNVIRCERTSGLGFLLIFIVAPLNVTPPTPEVNVVCCVLDTCLPRYWCAQGILVDNDRDTELGAALWRTMYRCATLVFLFLLVWVWSQVSLFSGGWRCCAPVVVLTPGWVLLWPSRPQSSVCVRIPKER